MDHNNNIKSNQRKVKFRLSPKKALYRVGFSSRKGISISKFIYYENYNDGIKGLDILKQKKQKTEVLFDVRKVKSTKDNKYFVPIINDYVFLERVYRDGKGRIIKSELRNKFIIYREEKFLHLLDKKRKTAFELLDYFYNKNTINIFKWLYENGQLQDDFIEIFLLGNKIIISCFDEKQINGKKYDAIICKDIEDANKLYHILKIKNINNKQFYFFGVIKNQKKSVEILNRLQQTFNISIKNLMFKMRTKILF